MDSENYFFIELQMTKPTKLLSNVSFGSATLGKYKF